MKQKICVCFALSVLTLLPFSIASGATLFNNGSFNSLDGNGMGDALQGEDFVLSSTSNLTAIRFWTLEAQGAYLGSLTWSINSDNSNEPGASLAGSTLSPTTSSVGSALGLNIVQYDFNIAVNNLSAGTYWLVLHDGANIDVDFQDMYWAHTDLNVTNTGTARGLEQNLPGGVTWNATDQEHAFVVFGDPVRDPGPEIPEPATVVLVSAGLAAICLTRRSSSR